MIARSSVTPYARPRARCVRLGGQTRTLAVALETTVTTITCASAGLAMPFKAFWRRVSSCHPLRPDLGPAGQRGCRLRQPHGISGFVVVPGCDGDEVAAADRRQGQVDDRGLGLADDPRRCPLAGQYAEDARQRALVGRGREGVIEFGWGGLVVDPG